MYELNTMVLWYKSPLDSKIPSIDYALYYCFLLDFMGFEEVKDGLKQWETNLQKEIESALMILQQFSCALGRLNEMKSIEFK
jgi:hypothetical protein